MGTLRKVTIPYVVGAVSAAVSCAAPSVYAEGGEGVSPGEFNRYQNEQELGLELEQALQAKPGEKQPPEEELSERRRLEDERFRQRLLLEQQRRWLATERAKARPLPEPGTSKGITLQRLQREQSSERLRRKLTR